MAVSRRTFLRGVAALPIAARLDGLELLASSAPRVVVVGAGAFGGWTALQLRNRGADVVLVDSAGPGNPRSSSGGKTRVIRAIYGSDRIYSEMVKRAFTLWETIDAASDGDPLYVQTGALWLHRGDDAYVRSSVSILADLGFPLDKLRVEDAARRYPQINFGGIRSVWFERKAGALFAQRACVAVRDAFANAGGIYRTAPVKPGTITNAAMSSIRLEDGSTIEADVFVFACGPWLGKLFPDVLGSAIRPTRQEVYYFRTPEASKRYAVGTLPVWVDFGERIVYGVPDVEGRTFKIADDTRGEDFDPTTGDRTPKKEGIARARRFLSERFPELKKAPLVAAWVCQYENSPDGHLIIDRHPEASNVWVVGGGSGHGFKLSPAIGEMTAEAIVSGKSIPSQFHLARLRDIAKPSTQFETKKE